MTSGPWMKMMAGEEAVFTFEYGTYVAIMKTRLGPGGQLWRMDPEDMQLMLTSPMIRQALQDTTAMLRRLSKRYPKEAGLTSLIRKNERLLVESLEGDHEEPSE